MPDEGDKIVIDFELASMASRALQTIVEAVQGKCELTPEQKDWLLNFGCGDPERAVEMLDAMIKGWNEAVRIVGEEKECQGSTLATVTLWKNGNYAIVTERPRNVIPVPSLN